VTVKDAVSRFLTSKRNENLADSTLDKLTTIFEKQFLTWATSYGFVHITEITTVDLEGFRDTWTDGPLAKKKKQERLIGFLYYCLRLGWIKSNPAVLLGRIRADGPPTDYFPAPEFAKITDATYNKGQSQNRQRTFVNWQRKPRNISAVRMLGASEDFSLMLRSWFD
jgi:integrase/recombinase XerD